MASLCGACMPNSSVNQLFLTGVGYIFPAQEWRYVHHWWSMAWLRLNVIINVPYFTKKVQSHATSVFFIT